MPDNCMTIRDVLDSLSRDDRATLDYAFEHSFAQHVILPNGTYVGVNTSTIPHLKPIIERGKWSYGVVKK